MQLDKKTIFVLDEAGMATEPDLLQAFVGLVGSVLLLILGGDPKQLGPVVQNHDARPHPQLPWPRFHLCNGQHHFL